MATYPVAEEIIGISGKGQRLSRIAALTTSQITIRDDTVPVRFGDHTFPSPSRSLTGCEGTSTVVSVSIDR